MVFTVMMVYISISILGEGKPASACNTSLGKALKRAVLYVAAFLLFAGGEVVLFLASQPLCTVRRDEVYFPWD